jgi:hypothetical protein
VGIDKPGLRRKEGNEMTKKHAFTFFGLGLLLMALFNVGAAQQVASFGEVASGEGTLTTGDGDKLKINAVAVFLRENGKAEVWLMTPGSNVYLGGRWFRGSDSMVDLEITDDTNGGCASGSGSVFLTDDCVPIAKLTMTISRLDGTRFEADFITKNTRPCLDP